MNIKRKRTAKGVRSVLTYWYRGVRYRPVLGLNLSLDQEREAASTVIKAIHTNVEAPGSIHTVTPSPSANPTFSEFVSSYLKFIKAKRHDHDRRNENILNLHLIPHFGQKPLSEIRLDDGLAYLEKRQASNAADGTIERECAVLMAVLNLAVDMEAVERNRLRRLPDPAVCET